MIKGVIHLLTIIMGMWVVGEPPMAAENSLRSNEVQIIFHQKGKQRIFDEQSLYWKEVIQECEKLFRTSNNGYRMIVTEDQLDRIKKKQVAIEVIYYNSRPMEVERFGGQIVYVTKLLIPLKKYKPEQFTSTDESTVIFFLGYYAGKSYAAAWKNTGYGVKRLKDLLQKMSIKID